MRLGIITVLLLSLSSLIASAQTKAVPDCGEQLSSQSILEGVPAKSNGVNQNTGEPCKLDRGTYGPEYQCTEYVKRFYSQALGAHSIVWTGNAFSYYSSAPTKMLFAFPNGGQASPAVEDIVVYDGYLHNIRAGHVAVVTAVTPSSVKLIEQNFDATGVASDSLTVNNGTYTLANRGSDSVTGWLRSVNDGFDDNYLNLRRWLILQPPPGFVGAVSETAQQLQISAVSGVGGTGLQSLCSVSGDFDVRVDYGLLNWPSDNLHSVRIYARELGASIIRGSFTTESYSWTPGSNGVTTSDTTGTLRMTRKGNTATGYYLQDGSWIKVGGSNVNTEPVHFDIDLGTNYATALNSLAFYDNFNLVTGTISCPLDIK